MITSDFHLHSNYSTDSTAEMKDMVNAAISKGLTNICFTEHTDHGYPYNPTFPEGSWKVNIDSYLYELLGMREEFGSKINISFGIEIGMQEHVLRENTITSTSQRFDFIIGSIHVVNGWDTYASQYFEGKTDKQAMEEYFNTQLANIKKFKNFDVLGHMNYIVRTVPGKEAAFKYADFKDVIDETLRFLIENGKGIEINTSCLKNEGFVNPNPNLDIVKRYKELGGEIITFGSDAHEPKYVGFMSDLAEEIMKAAGFDYYCTFTNREPIFHRL